MITFLHGKLIEALPTQVTVDVHGVGYETLIPLSSYDKLPPPGQDVKLLTHLLSGISVAAFRGAVANGDIKALSQISGVGKKTAERIIVELRDKIGAAGAWEASSAQRALSPEDQKVNDAVLALMALGFKQVEAHDSVRKVQTTLGPNATVEDLVRACLKKGA
jgi:Holliday junction DNA helicase RuvA